MTQSLWCTLLLYHETKHWVGFVLCLNKRWRPTFTGYSSEFMLSQLTIVCDNNTPPSAKDFADFFQLIVKIWFNSQAPPSLIRPTVHTYPSYRPHLSVLPSSLIRPTVLTYPSYRPHLSVLPSTLIRDWNGAFNSNTPFKNGEQLKTPVLRLSVDGKRFDYGGFRNDYNRPNHEIFLREFFLNTNPK